MWRITNPPQRKSLQKTIVSTQFIAVNNPVLPTYQTDDAIQAAIASYGGVREEEFLTPNPLNA